MDNAVEKEEVKKIRGMYVKGQTQTPALKKAKQKYYEKNRLSILQKAKERKQMLKEKND